MVGSPPPPPQKLRPCFSFSSTLSLFGPHALWLFSLYLHLSLSFLSSLFSLPPSSSQMAIPAKSHTEADEVLFRLNRLHLASYHPKQHKLHLSLWHEMIEVEVTMKRVTSKHFSWPLP